MYLQVDSVIGLNVFKFNSRNSRARLICGGITLRPIGINCITMIVYCREMLKVDSVKRAERKVLICASDEDAMAADSFSTLAQDGPVTFCGSSHHSIFEHE